MLYLNPNSQKIKSALAIHYSELLSFVQNRRNNCGNQEIIDFLTDNNLDIILKSGPHKLMQIQMLYFRAVIPNYSHSDWVSFFKAKKKRNKTAADLALVNRFQRIYDCTKSIFDYENHFSKKNSPYSTYDLAENLNINTCIYCNRLYTKTVIKPSKITRPEFDHWFAKSRYPLLAISFFNLIPSCHVCNSSVKGTLEMNLKTHIHPYIDNTPGFSFSYYNKKKNSYGFKIVAVPSSKGEITSQAFKIEEIYKMHEDEIEDLRKIKDAYSEKYLDMLVGQYKGLTISEDEVYRLAFGTYNDEESFERRPLSKMKRDILIELGILKKV